jgi:hypothetical protein
MMWILSSCGRSETSCYRLWRAPHKARLDSPGARQRLEWAGLVDGELEKKGLKIEAENVSALLTVQVS